MRINGGIFDPLRPDRAAPASSPAPGRPNQTTAQPGAPAPPKADSVNFSSAGRALAGRAAASIDATFDPERVAELRTRVMTGAYNTLDIVDQVARRILTRGDL